MIGIFDSGFGGLTKLKAFLEELPEYDYLYLGDSARNPYGNHSKETILRYTGEGVEFLFEKGAKLVILACNTASANALRTLQEEMIRKPGATGRNILGVVVPIAEAIAENGAGKVAIIGTNATVESGVYEGEIKKLAPEVKIFSKACPLLVPLIEEGWAKKMETKRILKSYLRDLKMHNPDLLVPACTHYPILQDEIQRIMGKGTAVMDTGKIVAKKLRDYLERHPEIEGSLGRAKDGKTGKREFYSTDDTEKFREMGSVFLGERIDEVKSAILGQS